jgi:hypothetical protein
LGGANHIAGRAGILLMGPEPSSCFDRPRVKPRQASDWNTDRAIKRHTSTQLMEAYQSFAKRRHRPSQANLRSTTQRRGRTSKPWTALDRLMISMCQSPSPFNARPSFGLA